MSEKISDYTATNLSNPIKDDDLLDVSNYVSPATYDVSKKITVREFKAFLNLINIYNSDGSLDSNRIITALTFWTKFLGGDVIVEMDNESDDYAFKVNSIGGVLAAKLGYDQATQSAVLQLQNLSGVWYDANDGIITTDALFKAQNGVGVLTLRAFATNDFWLLGNDENAASGSYVYGGPLNMSAGTVGGGTVDTYKDRYVRLIADFTLGASAWSGLNRNNTSLHDGTYRDVATANDSIKLARVDLSLGIVLGAAKTTEAVGILNGLCTYAGGVDFSTAQAGFIGNVKTDSTAYFKQLGFNNGGGAFETKVIDTVATADRTITLPDADINFETAITETLNFATDAAGQVSTMTFANGVLVSRTLSV